MCTFFKCAAGMAGRSRTHRPRPSPGHVWRALKGLDDLGGSSRQGEKFRPLYGQKNGVSGGGVSGVPPDRAFSYHETIARYRRMAVSHGARPCERISAPSVISGLPGDLNPPARKLRLHKCALRDFGQDLGPPALSRGESHNPLPVVQLGP